MAHDPLQYYGGQVLRKFKIYPLYYGPWSHADITNQQAYLDGLGGYLSGRNRPTDQQPMMWQYGVNEVTLAPAAASNANATPALLQDADVLNIIHAGQRSGLLPPYEAEALIIVFLSHGFSLNITGGCAYHSHESLSAFYAVVPQDCGPTLPLVTAHEIFEAAADPYGDGWDEPIDGCTTTISLSFGQIPGAADNTNNGECSATGYTNTNELQAYGWPYDDFRQKYDELWPQGWRLYILQSYLSDVGQVLYNAVWRPGSMPEIQVYGWPYDAFRQKYDELWSQSWRLHILQTYVAADGQTLYNAVWCHGSLGEEQRYASAYESYRQQYDQLWPLNWRLQSLQSYASGGEVLYNAVWRQGSVPEIQAYGWPYDAFRQKYDELWPQGWRLYILQAFVSPDGQVLYNAVWRKGTMPEIQAYGWPYEEYREKYDELWPQGWRLYILDVYVTPNGQARYNAVWRIGTSNRPL